MTVLFFCTLIFSRLLSPTVSVKKSLISLIAVEGNVSFLPLVLLLFSVCLRFPQIYCSVPSVVSFLFILFRYAELLEYVGWCL